MRIVLAGLALVAASAFAQYPNKPVTIVVGFEPGGGTDTTARIVQGPLGEQIGQQVVVENRAGAGGNIAVDYVAKQAPDGYSIVLANVGALTVNPHILKTPYDPLKDLLPISMAAEFANVLVVQPGLGVNTVADYVKLARSKPATITYASSGIGGAGHLAGELLRSVAKVDIVHVPYKGGGPAMQGFLGGQVQLMFESTNSIAPHVKAGRVRALAVTGEKRAISLPDVPTLIEAGVPGYEVNAWSGIITTAGVPRAVLDRLNAAVNKAILEPKTKELLFALGSEGGGGTPEEFGALIRKDSAKWAEVVKRSGAKID